MKEFEKILMKNKRYIHTVVDRYIRVNTPEIKKDLYQTAYISYYQAWLTYDETKGASLNTYAAQFIRNEIALEFPKMINTIYMPPKKVKDNIRTVSTETELEEDLKLIDTLPSSLFNCAEENIEKDEKNFIIQQLVKHLNEKEIDLIQKVYYQGLEIEQIARIYGKNTETVRVAHKKLLKKLKNILTKE